MRKKQLFTLVLALFFVASSGSARAAGYANPQLLLSPQQVKANIGKSDWVVVDCRPLKNYLKGHIPGAISLGKRCDKALRDPTARMFTNMSKYEKILGSVGIGNNTHVAFYHGGLKTLTRATVAFWVMEALGHDKAHLLNGGLEAWKAAGFKLDKKPTMKKAVSFKVKFNPQLLATTGEILKIARGERKGVQLIDSRTAKEYQGKDMRAVRAGHVPNVTANIPHVDTLVKKKGKSGKMVATGYLSANVLESKFGKLDKNKRTIGYCQTGTRSTLTYLELRLMGFKNIANWDDSWRVYGSLPDSPIENEQFFNFAQFRKMNKKLKKLEAEVKRLQRK
ncbi:hypothetical protein MNBD_NITROSPINAE04-1332 [hydrothermal vent metagenome]|uniref:Rhodanese domain-containing protein n=1 Tax=hydrothermal vent metagenome TaxID=652676 RepID=A0A3B1BTG4_9ZZZZ